MQKLDSASEFFYVRLRQIIGDKKANPPIPPIVPVAASTWWLWVRQGIAPQPIRLSRGVTVWRMAEVLNMCAGLAPKGGE